MPELNEESTETSESLEAALTRNLASLSSQTESTDSAPEPETGDVSASEEEPEIAAEQVQESDEDPLEPLEKWTDDQKDVFRGLDRKAQQFLLDRHKDVESYLTKETQSLSETRKRYERLDDVLRPYDELARKNGIDLTPHIAQAMQAYMSYQRNPLETVQALIQSAGLSPDQVFEDDSVDPSIRALRTELQDAKREIAELKRSPDRDTSSAQKQLDDFKSAKNDDGTLRYPHFDQLKSLMAPMVANGTSLEEAYKEALWTLPDYRKEQLKAAEKKSKDELEVKRKEKAAKAKKASEVLPSSDVDKGTGLKPAKNWGEALQHTLSQMK